MRRKTFTFHASCEEQRLLRAIADRRAISIGEAIRYLIRRDADELGVSGAKALREDGCYAAATA